MLFRNGLPSWVGPVGWGKAGLGGVGTRHWGRGRLGGTMAGPGLALGVGPARSARTKARPDHGRQGWPMMECKRKLLGAGWGPPWHGLAWAALGGAGLGEADLRRVNFGGAWGTLGGLPWGGLSVIRVRDYKKGKK